MITNINSQTLDKIRNLQFRNYAKIYVDIYEDVMSQIKKSGIQIDTQTYEEEIQEHLKRIGGVG